MTKKTHIAIGTLVSIPFIASPIGLLGLFGAIAPDLDIKLGMIVHRTFTHSLIFLLFTTLIINIFSNQIALIWFISYSSHLFLDSLTVSGIPLMWGISKKKYGLRFCGTGLLIDKLLCIIGTCMLFVSIGDIIVKMF